MLIPPLASEVLAGYVAGSAKTLAFYPLDTLTTLREVGVRGQRTLAQFYAGCPLTLLAAAPYALIFHTALWLCERALRELLPTTALRLVASTAGAIAAAVVGVPFECLKHRVQLGVEGYSTPRQAFESTMRGEGVAGLYAGFQSTLVRNVPYNALHFGLFEAIGQIVLRVVAWPASLRDMMAGALAGALTALITTPLDVVNTRLQTQAVSAPLLGDAFSNATAYAGPAEAFMGILEQGGPNALMQGAGVRVAQFAPSAIVFFVVYEAIRRRLGLTVP